jgi:hypothetical protein
MSSLPIYRLIAHDVTTPVTMHLEDKLAIYKQSKFKCIVREQLPEDTLRICDVSAIGL